MADFWADLKRELLNMYNDKWIADPLAFYNTIWCYKDRISEIVENYNAGDWYLSTYQEKNDYAPICGINIYGDGHGTYYYNIKLTYSEKWHGYCECKPGDEGYNAEHSCCGCGCDWDCPSVQVQKIETILYADFPGHQRDLWKYDDVLEEELGVVKRDKVKQIVEKISSQIEELQERKRLLEKGVVS